MKTSMMAWAVLGALSGLGAAGCSMETGQAPGDDVATENVGEVKSAMTLVACDTNIYDACWEKTDSTGLISTRVYRCKTSGYAQHPGATCPVESDRVLVGGGAEIVDGGPNGGLLYRSFPIDSKWYAFSKDHVYRSAHTIRAYAIGLRFTAYSVDLLKNQIHITPGYSSSTPQSAPVAIAFKPQDDILLGGGADAIPSAGEGQLLTVSTPWPGGWIAHSKDHIKADPGWVTAYAISMPKCPPGLTDAAGNQICLTSTILQKSATNTSGYYGLYAADQAANSLVTGVGAMTEYQSMGRMLVSVYPSGVSSGAAFMVSKDHGYVDAGVNDTVSFVALSRQ
jgi:hypothetical protein